MDLEQRESTPEKSEGTALFERDDPAATEPMAEISEECSTASEPETILLQEVSEEVEQNALMEQLPAEELSVCEEQGSAEQSVDPTFEEHVPEQIPGWNTQQPPQWGAIPPRWDAQPPQGSMQQPPYGRDLSYKDGYYPNGPYAAPQKVSQPWKPYGQMPPQPAYYAPPKPKEEKNVGAIVAIVCSLVGILLLNSVPFLAAVLGITSICGGWLGLKRAKEIGRGKVCSVIGLVIGCLELIVSVAMIAMMMTLVLRVFEKLTDVFKEFAK